ncbi:hypothetical protein HAHE_36850 [Haloferula helveola]|uniref:Peptidase C39 domain-containing protein n=1 Tax=Haloferula helveola TaxID=490095 RepID=A0ABN6HBB9_9BACT|nr:hypothetical protein HAHE_36850 [Haloferula helveola]
MKYLPKIQQETRWSCGLACIESILLSIGVDFPQRDMLSKFATEFPDWSAHPGKIAPADFPSFFEAAGVPVNMLLPEDIPGTVAVLPGSIGAIVGREKWWKDEKRIELVDNWHALRLREVRDTKLIVMSPGFEPQESTVEVIPMDEVKMIQSRVYVFHRKMEDA